jgi:hypothetical protein
VTPPARAPHVLPMRASGMTSSWGRRPACRINFSISSRWLQSLSASLPTDLAVLWLRWLIGLEK